MNYFEQMLYFLQGEMTTPTPFGWFHLLCLGFVVVAVAILYVMRKRHGEIQLKVVLGVYGFTAFTLELLKQLIWSFNYDSATGVVTWDYQWYAAPFQLCTTPIFISLICFALKKGKLREQLLSYMAYFTILGSISAMILPDSCFTSDILVNIHTMWLHLGSFVVSVYLLMSGEIKVHVDTWKKGMVVFLGFVGIALVLNLAIYHSGVLNGETFDMFYISPYFVSSLPVFDIIQQKVPYVIFLASYILALMIGALAIHGISLLISWIYGKITAKVSFYEYHNSQDGNSLHPKGEMVK